MISPDRNPPPALAAGASSLTVASTSTPLEIAWARYDAAVLGLQRIYERAGSEPETWETDAKRQVRMEAAVNVARLWREFMALYVGPSSSPGAA